MRVLARISARLSVFGSVVFLLYSLSAKGGVSQISVISGSLDSLLAASTSNQLGYTDYTAAIQNATGWTEDSRGSTVGHATVFTGNNTRNLGGQYGSAYGDEGTPSLRRNLHFDKRYWTTPDRGNLLAMDVTYDQVAVSKALRQPFACSPCSNPRNSRIGTSTSVNGHPAGHGLTGRYAVNVSLLQGMRSHATH